MQYEKGGSLLILGTPHRIILADPVHVVVEGGKSLTLSQARVYPYSPPATSKMMVQPQKTLQQVRLL